MITGINKVVEHDERSFHLQAEDLGTEAAVFEVRVYVGGTVLWQKRVSYAELLEQSEADPEVPFEKALRAKIEKTLWTVEAAIVKGKIG